MKSFKAAATILCVVAVLPVMLAGCAAVSTAMNGTPAAPAATQPPTETTMPVYTADLQPTTLSDNRLDYEISFDGKVCRLPAAYDYLSDMGFEPSEDHDINYVLETNNFSYTKVMKHGSLQISVEYMNISGVSKALKDCPIGQIQVRIEDFKNPDHIISLAKGVTIGKTTKEQVIKAYGEPDESYDGTGMLSCTYSDGDYKKLVLTFDGETKLLYDIQMQNFGI